MIFAVHCCICRAIARHLSTSYVMAKSKYEYVRSYEQDARVAVNNFIALRIDGRGFHRYAPCLKKLCKIVFVRTCQISTNFYIFRRKMAKRLELCELHSFSTSPDSRHHTTVLNTDVPNCYTTVKVFLLLLIAQNKSEMLIGLSAFLPFVCLMLWCNNNNNSTASISFCQVKWHHCLGEEDICWAITCALLSCCCLSKNTMMQCIQKRVMHKYCWAFFLPDTVYMLFAYEEQMENVF